MRGFAIFLAALVASVPASAQQIVQASQHQRFVVALDSQTAPEGLRRMHSSVLRVTDMQGRPVANAKIAIDGKPEHGLATLPTAPEVTQYLGDGRYRIEGLKYTMGGKWELQFAIAANGASDTAVLDFEVR